MRIITKLSILALTICLPISPVFAQETLPNLAVNPSFESNSNWQISNKNDAEGSFQFDSSVARSGTNSLKLTKTNGLGYVELRSEKPIHVEADKSYTFRGWFRADNAPISSLLLFRISTDGEKLRYDSSDRSAGHSSQSLLINSPKGQWEKRIVSFNSKKAQDVYLHIVLWGNPTTVWLDDLEFTATTDKIKSVSPTFKFPYTEEQVLDILKDAPNSTARVIKTGNETQLQIDGKAQPPIFYKGTASTETNGDIEAFGKAGVRLVSIPIRLGQSRFAYAPKDAPPSWDSKGQVNLELFDEEIINILRKDPHTKIILGFSIYPYKEWGDENPDEIVRNAKGERGYGIWGNLTGYTDDLKKVSNSRNEAWWYPSYQSQKWREDSGAVLAQVATHLKTSIYGKAVVGFFIGGGHDGRFATDFYDYSKGSEDSFRAWALQKYGSVADVSKAWNVPLNSTDDIKVPQFNENSMEALKPYQGPGQLLDYRAFRDEGSWTLRDEYAKILKENIGKPVVALCYNDPIDKNFLSTKYLDGSGDMSYYPYRNPGYALGWLPGDGFKNHNKLFFQELDLRSYIGSRYGAEYGYNGMYQMWIGAGLTHKTWDNIHRKMVGVSMARGYGWWYYDMGRYFADSYMHEKIAETDAIANKLITMPESTFRPDVCIITRDYPDHYLTSRFAATDSARLPQDMMFESSGVPFEKHYLDDVLNDSDLQNFKVYIFQQNSFITEAQRSKIKQKLLNKGRTIVWMNDVGYVSENGKSVSHLSDLTGIKIATEEKYTRLNSIISNHDSPLTKNALPFQGAAEMKTATMNTNGGPNAFSSRYQPFWIEDPSATAVATYHETGQTSMAVKKMADWTSIYLAAPQAMEPQLMRNIAEMAGAFIAGDAGQQLDMNGNFASLHGLQNGEFTLHLPPNKSRVVDAISGKVLLSEGNSYTFSVEAKKTYWFFFE